MDAEWLRELCLSFPGTTEQIQWSCDLLFKVGGRMYAVTPLEPAPVWLSFKASPEKFAELTERQDIVPAPYLARAQWVALQTRGGPRRGFTFGLPAHRSFGQKYRAVRKEKKEGPHILGLKTPRLYGRHG